jgi:hypothetical protein
VETVVSPTSRRDATAIRRWQFCVRHPVTDAFRCVAIVPGRTEADALEAVRASRAAVFLGLARRSWNLAVDDTPPAT